MEHQRLVAGVELGGTKCIAVLARESRIVARTQWPTSGPSETLGAINQQLREWQGAQPFEALGIASFGPLSLQRTAANYGVMLDTPKPGWSGVELLQLRKGLEVPFGLETDVTAAAMAEARWGASIGCTDHVYITIGTGVGGGVISGRRPVRGSVHPEVGHIRVRRAAGDTFRGLCPFHGDCIEGLVSGPALARRAEAPLETLPEDHPLWGRMVGETAELLTALYLLCSPQRIVIGGGVVQTRPWLFPLLTEAVATRLNGYPLRQTAQELASIIVPPVLGGDAGPLGSVVVGLSALEA